MLRLCLSRFSWVLALALAPCAALGQGALAPDEGVPIIDCKDAGKFVDQEVIVQGKIFATNKLRTICFLNFDRERSFTAIIRSQSYSSFPQSPEIAYAGKLVRIRGRISTYEGKPQIEVFKPDQIRILTEAEPIPAARPADIRPRAFEGRLTLATYNVRNLFDEHDDPYRDDERTPPKPRAQLEKLAETIRKLDADVLAVQEVENREYLERFVRAMLPDMGYEVVCFEGNDPRGIDNAVLTRLPVGPVTSYRHVRFSDGSGGMTGFRRDLLRVRIEPPGFPSFDVFVVHFKSKSGSRGDGGTGERLRLAEATQARKILDSVLREDAQARFVICGDFNDIWDSPAMKTVRGQDHGALFCPVSDLGADAATFNRTPHRSMIDFILCSPAMASCIVPKSYKINAGSVETSGSDHNPVGVRFTLAPAPDSKTE